MRCHSPIPIKDHGFGDREIHVGCGNCPYCAERKSKEWAYRLMQEDRVSNSSYFVTLTYNTKNVPITKKGYMTLSREDLQKYIKRLRHHHAKTRNSKWRDWYASEYKPIRYYAVGEYGSKRGRPHYHAIIFNAHKNHILQSWREVYDKKLDVYIDMGGIDIGTVTRNSCRYVMKYMMKDQGYRRSVPFPYPYDGIPQFAFMSRNIGSNYLTPAMIRYHKADLNRNYCTWPGGYRCPMPRYYRDRIWTDTHEREVMLDHIVTEVELDEKDKRDYAKKIGRLEQYYAKAMSRKAAQKNLANYFYKNKKI